MFTKDLFIKTALPFSSPFTVSFSPILLPSTSFIFSVLVALTRVKQWILCILLVVRLRTKWLWVRILLLSLYFNTPLFYTLKGDLISFVFLKI